VRGWDHDLLGLLGGVYNGGVGVWGDGLMRCFA
jgi:hypothetical protein